MKILNLKRIAQFCVLAIILAFTGIVPAFAQNNSNANARTDDRTAERRETPRVAETDDDTDWGWLGLLGLLGLAGLLPKRRSIEVKGVRDTDETRTTNASNTTR
jgi:MYXO-CTERM domain-containing protein